MVPAREIAERLADVQARVSSAERRGGREPGAVTLVLASKTQLADAIVAAYEAGARDFGENYVQEALAKQETLRQLRDLRWHLIGHLQTNKARLAANAFQLIHSVDSVRAADALARARSAPRVRALIEVNLGGEATKTGASRGIVETIINDARDKIDIAGFMTIPPADAPEMTRRFFAQLREMRDHLAARTGLALSELSMGMTDDFEIAIEEGATFVRVGRAIFGERMR